MILGIDPGLSGAIALLDEEGEIIEIYDMPISAKTSGKGNQVNAYLLAGYIGIVNADYSLNISAVIERVHAMPKQGVTSSFGFGRTLGVIEGVLASLSIPIEWVTPQKWKKQNGLIGKDKDAARTLCIERYPKHLELFKRKKDCGRADAVLIGFSHQQDEAA